MTMPMSSPAGDDVFLSRSALRSMDLLRVDRYESLQTVRHQQQATSSGPRRRSEPFDVAPFSLSGDSSPIDEHPRPVTSVTPGVYSVGSGLVVVGGGYMSDSSSSKKQRKVKLVRD